MKNAAYQTSRADMDDEPFFDASEIVRNIPYGLITTGSDGIIRSFNRCAERITGIDARIAIGMPCFGVFLEAERDAARAAGGLREGNPGICGEYEIARADGSVVPVVCTVASIGHETGQGKMFIFHDIAERKRLEIQLKDSESKYRRIFENSKDMIFIHTKGGILKDLNQACVEMLGYESKEELLRVASVERIYSNPMHRKVFQEQIDRHGYVRDFEANFLKKDGSSILCLISGMPIRGKHGEILGYEAMAKDITARMHGFRQLHQHHRELSLMHSVAVAMNLNSSLDEVLRTALVKVLEVLNLKQGAVFLIDQEKNDFHLQVQTGLLGDEDDFYLKAVLHDKLLMKSLLNRNITFTPQRTIPPFRAVLLNTDGSAAFEATCFLILTKEKASGFFALPIPPYQQITENDHQMLGSLCNFLGGAIENTRLVQAIRRHREELKRLTAKLFHSQEEERKRIAQELHDEAGQALTGINFRLEALERSLNFKERHHIRTDVVDVKARINRTYKEMRRLSHRLHPALLTHLGLEPALEFCLRRISENGRMRVDFKMVGFEERMDPELETVIYRITQEAVNNALKHSRARHFKLRLIKSFPNIVFIAEDDGIGFNPACLENSEAALGLLGMRERAYMLGGKFHLEAAEGKGTRIRVEIPVKELADGP